MPASSCSTGCEPSAQTTGNIGQMRCDTGRGQLLSHVPPPGAPLDRERRILNAGEPGQPGPQVLPVSRGDLPALHLPAHGAG